MRWGCKKSIFHQFTLRQSAREIQFFSFFGSLCSCRDEFFARVKKLSRIFHFPTFFYLPDVSFSCSTKSRPVMSATEFGSMFDNSSRSGSLNIEMLHRFVFICPTSCFKCTFSTSPLSMVSSELCDVMVK